jgi:hypothetical protein
LIGWNWLYILVVIGDSSYQELHYLVEYEKDNNIFIIDMDSIERKRAGCANKVSVCSNDDYAVKYKRRNEKQNCERNIKRCAVDVP